MYRLVRFPLQPTYTSLTWSNKSEAGEKALSGKIDTFYFDNPTNKINFVSNKLQRLYLDLYSM